MKYKNLGAWLGVIAGILIWQIISIARINPKSLILPLETVPEGKQQSADDVSIEINYLSGKSDESKIVFEISLNTHSVDLDDIDFKKAVVMEKDGQTFLPWAVETAGSDHHRSAVLSFPRVGVPLKIVFAGTKEVERQEFGFENIP